MATAPRLQRPRLSAAKRAENQARQLALVKAVTNARQLINKTAADIAKEHNRYEFILADPIVSNFLFEIQLEEMGDNSTPSPSKTPTRSECLERVRSQEVIRGQ